MQTKTFKEKYEETIKFTGGGGRTLYSNIRRIWVVSDF